MKDTKKDCGQPIINHIQSSNDEETASFEEFQILFTKKIKPGNYKGKLQTFDQYTM